MAQLRPLEYWVGPHPLFTLDFGIGVGQGINHPSEARVTIQEIRNFAL